MGCPMNKIFPCCESETFFEQIQYGKKPEEICGMRTKNCLEWYMRKAVFYKRMFYILSIVNLAVPLASTVLMAQDQSTRVGIVLAGVTSLSASLLALYDMREKWIMYRTAAENIKSQYCLYCGKVFPYDKEDAHAKYLLRLEDYMAGVHVQWYALQKEKGDKGKQEDKGEMN